MAEPKLDQDLRALVELLADTRARFHRRETPWASTDALIAVDAEVREARARPPSAELEAQVRQLTARLRALDPR